MKHLIHGIGFSSTSAASKNERDTGKMIAIVLLPGGQMADDRQDDVQVSIVMNVGDDKDQQIEAHLSPRSWTYNFLGVLLLLIENLF